MKNDTYDIIIKCDTEEQRHAVLEKVDELKNKSLALFWGNPFNGRINDVSVDQKVNQATNVYFKESYVGYRDSEERELG